MTPVSSFVSLKRLCISFMNSIIRDINSRDRSVKAAFDPSCSDLWCWGSAEFLVVSASFDWTPFDSSASTFGGLTASLAVSASLEGPWKPDGLLCGSLELQEPSTFGGGLTAFFGVSASFDYHRGSRTLDLLEFGTFPMSQLFL